MSPRRGWKEMNFEAAPFTTLPYYPDPCIQRWVWAWRSSPIAGLIRSSRVIVNSSAIGRRQLGCTRKKCAALFTLSGAYYYFWLSNRLLFNYRHPFKISPFPLWHQKGKKMINKAKADSIFPWCFGAEGYTVLWVVQEWLWLSVACVFVSLSEKAPENNMSWTIKSWDFGI